MWRGKPSTRTLAGLAARATRGLTGTKEGCNEGDCGACTVMVTDDDRQPVAERLHPAVLPQLHGKAVRTVEGISWSKGSDASGARGDG